MTRLPRRFSTALLTGAVLLMSADSALAGWDNVFQVTCFGCRPRVSYSQYVANSCDSCAPAPRVAARPEQRVEYQTRSFYEPITVMKPETYLEPVEVRSKSFYWEPVTSYTYSSFYDPCTGACQKIATPRTSYRLQEQCNTSMRYVERTRMVQVQAQRLVTETVPVVTYSYSLPPRRSYSSPIYNDPPASGGPQVDEFRGGPSVTPEGGSNIPPTQLPTQPNSLPRSMPPQNRTMPANARTTSLSTAIRGEVVQNDQLTPRPGAKLVFMSVEDTDKREYVTADQFGNFDINLPAGEWYMYIGQGNGKAVFHKKLTIGEAPSKSFKVVSR